MIVQLFLGTMALAAAASPRLQPAQLEKFYSGSLAGAEDAWAYYSLNVNGLLPGWDLVLQVEQLGDLFSDPNLYLSFNEDLPTTTNYSAKCAFYGEDFCVVSSTELANASIVTIGVQCEMACDYRLQAELSEELLLDTGRTYKLWFHAEQERVIRFTIPDDPAITTVEIRGSNANKFDRFNMIMAKGNMLPSSDNALYLRPAWDNGYVGKFTSDCYCFCRGCNYTVLVSTEKEGYITVGAQVSGQIVDIKEEPVYDSVMFYHSQCYNFRVAKASQDLRVKLEAFSGDPNIFVNPGAPAATLDMSAFNSRDHFENEELVVTPAEREKVNASLGNYSICIFGNTAATYKLTVKNSDLDHFLQAGLSESGYLEHYEMNLFYFRDPVLAQNNTNVSAMLHVMVGSARLRTAFCEVDPFDGEAAVQEKCSLTRQFMLAEDPAERKENHLGTESLATNLTACRMLENGQRGAQVSCVLIVGIIGLFDWTTHFSINVKIESEPHHVMLKEGLATYGEMEERQPHYYRVTVANPKATKVKFLLSTVHGDPDMFISRNKSLPTPWDFEKRSIRCGIYPEQVDYSKEDNSSLEGDYYILVFGFVKSTYSIVYYIEAPDLVPKVKLMTGQRQRGVLKSANDTMLYYFRLASDMVLEEVQVRLASETGSHFALFLGIDFIPTPANFTLKGSDREALTFTKALGEERFYVLVQAVQTDSAGMAQTYTIGFFEQGVSLHLVEGVPLLGTVYNDTYEYFYLDVLNSSETYEVSLTSRSGGNPDLVLSFSDQFPDRLRNDFISEREFSTDSITVEPSMLEEYERSVLRETGTAIKVSRVYIGVYTKDSNSASFSVLVSRKETMIQLPNGQYLSGTVKIGEQKRYYFKTSGDRPFFSSLISRNGDGDLAVYVVRNMTQGKHEWDLDRQPDFEARTHLMGDFVWVNANDPKFMRLCGSSCILVLQVNGTASSSGQVNFHLMATRDIQELLDGVRIEDFIVEDLQPIRLYKYQKTCGTTCDLEIVLEPQVANSNLSFGVSLPASITEMGSIDMNKASWRLPVTDSTELVIQADDPQLKNMTSNMFVIGVFGDSNASFFLTATSFPHVTKKQLGLGDRIGFKKLQLGPSPDLVLAPNQIKYFYYENWVNGPIRFSYTPAIGKALTRGQAPVELEAVTLGSGARLPKTLMSFTVAQWRSSLAEGMVELAPNDGLFCVECFIIVRAHNLNLENKTTINIHVSQAEELGSGFASSIVVGKPAQVRLRAGQTAELAFVLAADGQQLGVDLQYFSGAAELTLAFGSFEIDLLNPKPSDVKIFGVHLSESISNVAIRLASEAVSTSDHYTLRVKARADLHASLLVSLDQTVGVLADGLPQRALNRHFTFLPPTDKFQLTVSARSLKFGSPFEVLIKRVNLNALDFKEYDFTASTSKLELFRVFNVDLDGSEALLVSMNTSELELTLSASAIQYLPVGKRVRGHVSNVDQNTYKIYEVPINPYYANESDLLVSVTPCNGKVNFFLSDDYNSLFEPARRAGFFDMVTQAQEGKLTSRVPLVAALKTVYIGVASTNELYDLIKDQLDSYFEVKAAYVPAGTLVQRYSFSNSRGDLQVIFTRQGDDVVVKWPQVVEEVGGMTRTVPADRIRYQVFAGKEPKTALLMNAECAVEKAEGIFGVYMSRNDEQDREVHLQRSDLDSIKVLGLLATIADTEGGAPETIAYEPYVITVPTRVYGVRVQGYQVVLLGAIGVLVLAGLVCLACHFRKRSRRIEYQESDLS